LVEPDFFRFSGGRYFVTTALEDRMLRDELTGYRKYAQSTPYRLVPFVW